MSTPSLFKWRHFLPEIIVQLIDTNFDKSGVLNSCDRHPPDHQRVERSPSYKTALV
ncbi:hypothetical protein IFO70_39600 [Phormidium tenue FACHB-886]|nr:hypothetical protein [Phormidium tenue FACHB-886]